ncbi:putative lipoprotein [Myxococcus stipitatus DSM 14675]|uniref:Putative lipoprotein n=1 Tax=Myxococcus stipitatus (strain DSM 14675 / JCM 12634 / Mx s8) TaxID=1278073 RepID=L7UC56_MYXSD|nr:serine protease [Myxococcus stipitatus]AGC45187.1 putative lipoprotein [Myxococcus stipitatus DSM 14675]
MTRFFLGAPVALLALASCAGAPSPGRVTPPRVSPGVVPVLASASSSASARLSRKERVQRILPHNVRLQVVEGDSVRRSASGVVVGSEQGPEGVVAWVVTNAHAVVMSDVKAPVLRVLVDRRSEVETHVGQVVATGKVPELDLALVKVPGLALPAVELAEEAELELGEDVVVAASPFGRALSLSGGMVSQVEWDRESSRPKSVKTDAPIGYGASGGGVYSLESGRLLAIVEGYRTAQVDFAVREESYSFDVPMPGETFAAPSTKVRDFLHAKGFGHILRHSLPGEGGVAHAAGR